ncbi:MAG: LysE family translocator [Candidatus Puniceispirillales bacterium]
MLHINDWLILALTCLAGAASPGPSVVVLIRSVTSTGVMAGVIFGISHGLGILIYAGLVSLGLVSLLLLSPFLFILIQVVGICFLVWIGGHMIMAGIRDMRGGGVNDHAHKADINLSDTLTPLPYWCHARDGFLIAFLNPKVAVFFTAAFSQFLTVGQTAQIRIQMAATAWIVDTLWYILLASIFGLPMILRWFRRHASRINLIMGGILICLSGVITLSLMT